MLYPSALIVLALPGLILFVRLIRDIVQASRAGLEATRDTRAWWGMGAVLLSSLLVAVAIGHGRARYPAPWASRYLALTQPIGITIYLLMVRLRAPSAIPQLLALGMAICVGWCWPEAISAIQGSQADKKELVKTLRHGAIPLSMVSHKEANAIAVGLHGVNPGFYLDCLLQMRETDVGIFRNRRRRFQHRPLPMPQAWKATSGKLSGGLQPVADPAAVSNRAIEATPGSEGAGTATFEVEVPARGSYQLCCRLKATAPGQSLAVTFDGGPLPARPLTEGPQYLPYVIGPSLDMTRGKHCLTVALPHPGTRLDLVELVPLPPVKRGD
jgi:hypothetical protein